MKPRPLFAPGTVQGYRRPRWLTGWLGTPAQRRDLWRFLLLLLSTGGLAALAGLLLGLYVGGL